MVYEKYLVKGDNVAEDINADGVVNVYDVTLILSSIGTVVTPQETATVN